jgi:uncharacterized protein
VSGPQRLGMFPLSTVLFPHALLGVRIFEPRFRALLADCLAADGEFGVVLIARGSEVGGGDERFDVGTVAHIVGGEGGHGQIHLQAVGTQRVRVLEWLPDDPYPQAMVEPLPPGTGRVEGEDLARAEAAVRAVRELAARLANRAVPGLSVGEHPEETLWRLCAQAPLSSWDHQQLLEIGGHPERLDALIRLAHDLAGDLEALLDTD